MKTNVKFEKENKQKNLLIQSRLVIFYKRACLQKYFRGRVLSIRVFSADGQLGTLSRDVLETRTAAGS